MSSWPLTYDVEPPHRERRCRLRRGARAARRLDSRRPGRNRHAARHQRQRQEHAPEMRHGHGAPDPGLGRARDGRRPSRSHAAFHRGDRQPRRGAGARGPPALSPAHRRREPAARGLPAARPRRDRGQPRVLLRDVPAPARAPPPARRLALRRPAADARDRARAHVLARGCSWSTSPRSGSRRSSCRTRSPRSGN